MNKIAFQSSPGPSIGIELELALVDEKTMALSNSIGDILSAIPNGLSDHFKPELMQSCLEINTGVCTTISEAEKDLRAKIQKAEVIADSLGVRFFWGATHPFSRWRQQRVTPNERYESLVQLLQEMARRLVTFGLHVHIGVDSGDKAVMICDRIMRHLPTLLALSCSSPFWENRRTGLQSFRSKIMEGLPTAGLPTLMRNWSEYVWLVNHMVDTGFINTIREIWWDVRPHHNFGTVEVRVCDMPGNLEHTMSIAALIQCLVKWLSDDIDEGAYQHDCHPMMVRQNKWRACRFGMKAELVDSFTFQAEPLPRVVDYLVDHLGATARQLECSSYLERLTDIVAGESWADRQQRLLDKTGDPIEVVRELTAQSRVSPLPNNVTAAQD